MGYNETEYAIVTASGLGLKGHAAIDFIKNEFQLEIPLATYWRHYGKIEATFPVELEYQTKTIIQKHIARLHMFYRLRTKLMKSLDDEEDPSKQARIISIIDKHEVFISQLESLSRKYFEKHTKEVLQHAKVQLVPVVN